MSDIYIPELIQLDSYWQKAVEDAVYDQLKGEKRLKNALKNRKIINQKLKSLGLKSVYSDKSLSRVESNTEAIYKSVSNVKCDSWCENSGSSRESLELDNARVDIPDREVRSHSGIRSRSGESRGNNEQRPDKKTKSPERPLLGDGSLEKMKKSQNSFNLEPMGYEDDLYRCMSELVSLSEECMDEEEETTPNDNVNKNIQWLHVRKDNNFDKSEHEICKADEVGDVIEKDGFQKQPTLKDKNYFMRKRINFSIMDKLDGSESRSTYSDEKEIPKAYDPLEDLFWETEVKKAIRKNTQLERRLHLALAKREILNENLKSLRTLDNVINIKVQQSQARHFTKRRNTSKVLSPFIKFYLNVYRELCHKCPIKEIAEEAMTRWWDMTLKKQIPYNIKNSKK